MLFAGCEMPTGLTLDANILNFREYQVFFYIIEEIMPKIQHNSLVNLTAFRQRNGILQKDLADFLGVSRGYISMVESGKSSLSRDNIDKIYNNPNHWIVDDLVPAYTRLRKAMTYLNETRNEKRKAEGKLSNFFLLGPYEDIDEAIKYGYSDIPVYLADRWCPGAPELNREWFLTGKGEMLIVDTSEGPSQIEVLQEKVDKLAAAIEEYKTVLLKMIDALPEKIVDTFQELSSK